MSEKKCSKCGEVKSVEDFNKSKSYKDGLTYWCKDCFKLYTKKNSEYIKKKKKQYRKTNSAHIKEYQRKNKKDIKAYKKQYVKNNLDKHRMTNRERRAMKRNALHLNHNKAIEVTLQQMANRLKNCLGIDFHMDHIFPLVKGGLHHHLNLQVISQPLNNKKHAKLSFYHPTILTFLDLDRNLLRQMFTRSKDMGFYEEIKTAIRDIKIQKNPEPITDSGLI